ncbi:type I restriction enzyme endonuclease domain-containing protein [Thermincola potens]|uniref:type I restriction enzyme endonuclease domain-containing protein n=1 Tax=Thermincola potens TaxID=863643 RepID=UPI001F623B71|nr:type I restriction enzyme endonuclease domain-containing protein [Thermincola potens]
MVLVRRTLNKYGYPPDKQQQAVETVMKQAEILTDRWAASTKPAISRAAGCYRFCRKFSGEIGGTGEFLKCSISRVTI